MSRVRRLPLPALVAVDEDQRVLEAVEDQLAGRYAADYRIECLRDPAEALQTLAELRDSSVEVALILVGQSLEASARDTLLDRVRQLHPHAKRVLVVAPSAWTDAAAARTIRAAIALGQVDHFVHNPAAALDEVFHEAVSDFLLEWARERLLVPQTVHIVGETWAGRAYELRDTFARCSVPHSFCLADSAEGREFVERAGADAELPLMVLPDGRILSDPSNAEIAEVAGAPMDLEEHTFDLVIVGSGPAGLSAAVYGASEGLRVLVVDAGGIGGQARSSSLIRNYLGFGRGVSGSRLAEEAYQQAASFGASFVFMHRVTALARADDSIKLWLADGRTIDAGAVILATGASYRRLGIESLEALTGAGVFYGGSASEAPGLTGKAVYVLGGGNSAGQAALHLARYAARVTVVVRAQSLEAGMSHYLVRTIEAEPKIEVRLGTEVVGGGGEGHLRELELRERSSAERTTVAADALFVLIGARPQTEFLSQEIARDEYGFLRTGDDLTADEWPLERPPLGLETSIPGVFAVGDVRHGSVKRVAAAVGEGSVAVQLVHRLVAAGEAGASQASGKTGMPLSPARRA
jgi:thioredoxin reductase (NADPH)